MIPADDRPRMIDAPDAGFDDAPVFRSVRRGSAPVAVGLWARLRGIAANGFERGGIVVWFGLSVAIGAMGWIALFVVLYRLWVAA